MSASVGLGMRASSAAADMICPDWQKPHCGTSSSIQARCTGWSLFPESPSMVVTRLPATAESGVVHERVGCPSTCTVHAPQRAMPHPYFVPVRLLAQDPQERSVGSGVHVPTGAVHGEGDHRRPPMLRGPI